MSTTTQQLLALEGETTRVLARFEARIHALRQQGLPLWTGILKDIATETRQTREQRDAEIYRQLMLLEEDLSELSAGNKMQILMRLGAIKGMLAALCLLLLGVGMTPYLDDDLRRPAKGCRVRVVRREGGLA